MLVEDESDVAGYIGVLFQRDTDNDTITFRQFGLEQRIIEALYLDDNISSVEILAD